MAASPCLYAGHDARSGVKVSNGPVRRNQIAEVKPVSARMRAKTKGYCGNRMWQSRCDPFGASLSLTAVKRLQASMA